MRTCIEKLSTDANPSNHHGTRLLETKHKEAKPANSIDSIFSMLWAKCGKVEGAARHNSSAFSLWMNGKCSQNVENRINFVVNGLASRLDWVSAVGWKTFAISRTRHCEFFGTTRVLYVFD